ncbi:MAG: hypothetical protein F6J89_03790 [Symploca sp. SIO1C4]|uniref:Uncharacterized protein n=1 Tax=Symploca sp. SIO1C4 TaxID=2607765 RepID=A0A6B3NC67_9CYAN|nr:hypothetical protein [Symploca sp. SIO1C4]
MSEGDIGRWGDGEQELTSPRVKTTRIQAVAAEHIKMMLLRESFPDFLSGRHDQKCPTDQGFAHTEVYLYFSILSRCLMKTFLTVGFFTNCG